MKRVRNSIIILLSAICLIAASKSDDDYFEISKNLKIMASVYEKLNSNYVDELLPGKIMKTGINAMLKSLDPYTVYICLLYTSPSPRDQSGSRMPSSA